MNCTAPQTASKNSAPAAAPASVRRSIVASNSSATRGARPAIAADRHAGDSGTNRRTNTVNSAGKTSSWWLITAYNSGYTQSSGTENRGSLNDGDDFFKLYATAGSKCTSTVDANGVCGGTTVKVPEPATLALTSIALLGVAGVRRRQSKAA